MSASTWPHDHDLLGTHASESIDEFSCFLLCPAKPPEYWNELYALVRGLCDLLGRSLGVSVRCFRSVDIVSAGIIHPEIWDSIRKSDIVIADISGLNGNVMFELGVAAAWLDKQRVIIIRQSREEEPRLFDINPARQIDYTVSPLGFERLKNQLGHLIEEGISGAPFEREQFPGLTPPVSLDLRGGNDDQGLWGPSGAHRRLLPGTGLEFGSLTNFRCGWLAVGAIITRNVRVSGRLRFSKRLQSPPYPPWIGIMLRSQGYLANTGHLSLVRATGQVMHTEERDGAHADVPVGEISTFEPSQFVDFDVAINEGVWRMQFGEVVLSKPIGELPYVFNEGRVIVTSQFCWVCLQELRLEEL